MYVCSNYNYLYTKNVKHLCCILQSSLLSCKLHIILLCFVYYIIYTHDICMLLVTHHNMYFYICYNKIKCYVNNSNIIKN